MNVIGNAVQGTKAEIVIDRVIDRVSSLVKFANENAARTHQAADRATGERPPVSDEQNKGPVPVRGGRLGQLEDTLDSLTAALEAQSLGINRINAFI